MWRILLFLGALAIASGALAKPVVESFVYNGETVYGIRELDGINLARTYLYEGGEPRVELNADGTGCWANHQRPCNSIKWWIHSDAEGNPMGESGAGGAYRTLIIQHVGNPSDGSVDGYSGFQLTVDNGARELRIAEERIKPF